uniref:Uncharacterized protein n=1 Tax=Neospora caninum (strain Liverpool) TaxID=572307 RepID=A0A0F7UAY1_NEOCL|nr:TPA: hypothetical protein BN1204_027920 [Neospora caninum Liverpool]
MCRCSVSAPPSPGGRQQLSSRDRLRGGGRRPLHATSFISVRRRTTFLTLFLEWRTWALLCLYLLGSGNGRFCTALFFRRGPGSSYHSFLFRSAPQEAQPSASVALRPQVSPRQWSFQLPEREERERKGGRAGFEERINPVPTRPSNTSKIHSIARRLLRLLLKDRLSSSGSLGFLTASLWAPTARYSGCGISPEEIGISISGTVRQNPPLLPVFSRPQNHCVHTRTVFHSPSSSCFAYCTSDGWRSGSHGGKRDGGKQDAKRGTVRDVTPLQSDYAQHGQARSRQQTGAPSITGSLLSLDRRPSESVRKLGPLCLDSAAGALPIHQARKTEEHANVDGNKNPAQKLQGGRTQGVRTPVASKTPRRKRRSLPGPKADAVGTAPTVETVEAAFADVVEAVQQSTHRLRSFDNPVERSASWTDERTQGGGVRSDGNEVGKMNPLSCHAESPVAQLSPGNTTAHEDRAQSIGLLPGLPFGLPPAVRAAVAKFKAAARDLLGLGIRKHEEQRGTQGSATTSARVDGEEPEAVEEKNKRTGTTGKSCVWFDVTKHRLMVDRHELMKELGETSKGSWTLRFLGTGAMQASVTRNTSAILFSRGDGVSWLFDCGGGASAAAFPPQPSSVVRPRLSPFLEKLASTSWMCRHLPSLSPEDASLSGPSARSMNSRKRRLRDLALQRKQADLERLVVQPSYTAALAIAAAAVADRAAPGEEPDANHQEDSQGTRPAAPVQSARKKRVSRIGKIFVTHLHGDHSLGIPSLLSQVAAGALLQREAAEGTGGGSKTHGSAKSAAGCGDTPGVPSPGGSDVVHPTAKGKTAPCADQKLEEGAGRDRPQAVNCRQGNVPSNDAGDGMPIVDIIGPEGLRNLLRAIFIGTHVRRCAPYRVHELKGVPCLHHGRRCSHATLPELPKVPFEAEGGSDLWPSPDGSYDVFNDGETKVLAVPIRHNVPTVGYVVEELGRTRRRLHAAALQPVVQRNLQALADWPALKDQPKAVYKLLSALQPGDSFTFPDGTRIDYDDAFEDEAHHLRKFCICVDTCDASLIAQFAKDCDLMIHESTLSESGGTPGSEVGVDGKDDLINEYLPYDAEKASTKPPKEQCKARPTHGSEAVGGCASAASGSTAEARTGSKRKWTALDEEAFARGHSTAAMAGEFAGRAGAQRLVLTHFSQRFKGDASLGSVALMKSVEREALNAMLNAERWVCQAASNDVSKEGRKECIPYNPGTVQKCTSHHGWPPRVLAAFDGMTLHIRRRRTGPAQGTAPSQEAARVRTVDTTDGEEAVDGQEIPKR